MPKDPDALNDPARLEVLSAWQSFDEYLTATRYAVRDPETGEPREGSYQDILTGRLIPKILSLKSPVTNPDLTDELALALLNRHLIPASPLLMSFGNPHTRRPGYFSCYPLGFVGDSLAEIEEMRLKMRTIYMAGGGAGIDLSRLRAKGSPVDRGQGIASGPVGFLPDFDAVTGTTNQGGRRRGALLVQMDWEHPDIRDFVTAKNFNASLNRFIHTLPAEERPVQGTHLANMNISVNAYGGFWENRELVDLIARNMWATGDPGLLFVDNMLRHSPLREDDEPRFSNPCGEYLASAGTACNLITVNAARLARGACDRLRHGGLDPRADPALWTRSFSREFWGSLGRTAGLAAYLGSIVLECSEGYPLPEIREKTQSSKPVGVGLSGFHTALVLAFWGAEPYGSPAAVDFARATQASLTLGTLAMSSGFARTTGHVYENAPYWNRHLDELDGTFAGAGLDDVTAPITEDLRNLVSEKGGFYNCLTTSQAPTGSVSAFLRNIDTGIEPFFALSVDRRVRDPRHGWVSFTLRPAELADLLASDPALLERTEAQTALKLSPLEQLNMLAAFQYHNHTGVSKTVNLPARTGPEEIKELITSSRDRRLKGFTVYRDTSLDGIITVTPPAGQAAAEAGPAAAAPGGASPDAKAPDAKPFLPYEDIGDDRPGRIYRARSASLTAHITLSHDAQNNIREVFVSTGEVGADINAIFTAFGMILSVALRKDPFLFDPLVKVLSKIKMDQRVVIHTQMSEEPIVGYSLPQAIGILMRQRKDYLDKGCQVPVPHEKGNYDLCPECHELALRREGSCRKCDNCGYSTC